LDAGKSILDHWKGEAEDVAESLKLRELPIRVMVDRYTPEPCLPRRGEDASVSVERDPFEYRGTGGVLRDLSSEYGDEDMLLVVNGTVVLRDPLRALLQELAEGGADVNLVSHSDGTPSSLVLLRCKTLRELSPDGFVDFKEQGLPSIAEKHFVRVVRRERASGFPVRNVSDYIRVLASHHREEGKGPEVNDAFREEWSAGFAIAEQEARVASSAKLHDSVVLAGGVVEEDAILVRSLVCSKGFVVQGQKVVDQLVTR
jgi:NDP-sugar pyrophosphorylase family protein